MNITDIRFNPPEKLPEDNRAILIKYQKGKSQRGGEVGIFLTQGYTEMGTANYYHRYDYIKWMDYTNRLLVIDNGVTKSSNKILGWIYIN